MPLILGLHSLKRFSLTALPGLLLAAGIFGSLWYFQPRPMRFETASQFKAFALQHGLIYHSGWSQAEIYWGNFYVADHFVGTDHLGLLQKGTCGQTPAWNGIVWVGEIKCERNPGVIMYPESFGGHVRIWGNLLAAGDPELLDHLEELHHRR